MHTVDKELPATATFLDQMAHMQGQINELQKYIKNLNPVGVNEKNVGQSDTTQAFYEKVSFLTILFFV